MAFDQMRYPELADVCGVKAWAGQRAGKPVAPGHVRSALARKVEHDAIFDLYARAPCWEPSEPE